MDFKINKKIIQVMNKLKKEVEIHVKSYVMSQWKFIIIRNLRCIRT